MGNGMVGKSAEGRRKILGDWTTTVGSHLHVRNPERFPDCRTDHLIGGGGNTDVCPGRQTPIGDVITP